MNYIHEWISLSDAVRRSENISIIVLNGVEHDFKLFKAKVLTEVETILKNTYFLNLDVRIENKLLEIKNNFKNEK